MTMKNITEFVKENTGVIFRFLEYNKFNIWTPEQQANKYRDEEIYLSTHYNFAKITDVIDTPNGALLELEIVDENDFSSYNHKVYKLLNDICLEKFDIDNQEEEDE